MVLSVIAAAGIHNKSINAEYTVEGNCDKGVPCWD